MSLRNKQRKNQTLLHVVHIENAFGRRFRFTALTTVCEVDCTKFALLPCSSV